MEEIQQLMEMNLEMKDMNYVYTYSCNSCEDHILDLFICIKYTQQYESRKYIRVSFHDEVTISNIWL